MAAAYIYAEDHAFLEGARAIDHELLQHIMRMTRNLEVAGPVRPGSGTKHCSAASESGGSCGRARAAASSVTWNAAACTSNLPPIQPVERRWRGGQHGG